MSATIIIGLRLFPQILLESTSLNFLRKLIYMNQSDVTRLVPASVLWTVAGQTTDNLIKHQDLSQAMWYFYMIYPSKWFILSMIYQWNEKGACFNDLCTLGWSFACICTHSGTTAAVSDMSAGNSSKGYYSSCFVQLRERTKIWNYDHLQKTFCTVISCALSKSENINAPIFFLVLEKSSISLS